MISAKALLSLSRGFRSPRSRIQMRLPHLDSLKQAGPLISFLTTELVKEVKNENTS